MSETVEQIRNRLARWVKTQVPQFSDHPCEESFLLKDDKLYGCRFSIGEATAVWIIGESTMEVRAPGHADTLVISGGPTAQRAA